MEAKQRYMLEISMHQADEEADIEIEVDSSEDIENIVKRTHSEFQQVKKIYLSLSKMEKLRYRKQKSAQQRLELKEWKKVVKKRKYDYN